MKRLYDETHPYAENDHRRTLWYQLEKEDGLGFMFGPPEEYGVSFLVPGDYGKLAEAALSAVRESLDEAQNPVPTETHWILYTHRRDQDAIGDTVRFTIMLRQKGGRFDCDIMYSDFLFASAFDEIIKIKQALLAALRAS